MRWKYFRNSTAYWSGVESTSIKRTLGMCWAIRGSHIYILFNFSFSWWGCQSFLSFCQVRSALALVHRWASFEWNLANMDKTTTITLLLKIFEVKGVTYRCVNYFIWIKKFAHMVSVFTIALELCMWWAKDSVC